MILFKDKKPEEDFFLPVFLLLGVRLKSGTSGKLQTLYLRHQFLQRSLCISK